MVKEDAERILGQYFHAHVKELHPSKDAGGYALYNFRADLLHETKRPMRVDLLELLDTAFSTDTPDLQPIRKLLLALLEDGQHHSGHASGPPIIGVHPCARKGSTSKCKEYVDCRYMFSKPLVRLDWDKLAVVTDD